MSVTLWSGACASLPPASPLATVPSAPLRSIGIGINDGFHGPLQAALVARYCGAGHPVLVRTPHLSGATLRAFQASTAPCPSLKTLALVEGPDVALAVDLAEHHPDKLELGNELELAPHNLTRQQYWDFIGQACQAVRGVDDTIEILVGSVYTLTSDTRARVLGALDACPGASVSLHLYQDLTEADLDWIGKMHVPVYVTETGSPTGCGQAKWQEQKDWLTGRVNLFSTVLDIRAVLFYQRPSGAGCTDLDTFGIEGKPAESFIFGP